MNDTVSGRPGPSVRLAAMNLLARREHSFHELLEKLVERFPELDPAQDIVPVLERLREEGLQSDHRFAETYVRYRSSRGIGPVKIRAELQPRRIDAELLDAALHGQGIDWAALCAEVFMRKFRPASRAPANERLRWQRFLLQRGFGHSEFGPLLRRFGGSAGGSDDPDD